MRIIPLALLLVGCSQTLPPSETVAEKRTGKADQASESGQVVVRDLCHGAPVTGPNEAWRHSVKSGIARSFGDPHHRGIDFVKNAHSPTQELRGEIAYGTVDKALEDEDVEIFACRGGVWTLVGRATTDDEGDFVLSLSAAERLPVGLRSLFVSVVGDRTGARFYGLVAPAGVRVIVSDIDGTLTNAENAWATSQVTGAAVEPWPSAAATLQDAPRDLFIVYLTARPQPFTDQTRGWLEEFAFPAGPLLLPDGLTLPGEATIQFKSAALAGLESEGVSLVAGIGDRASDVEAYSSAALAPAYTFMKLPEYQSELQELLDRGLAVGFNDYAALAPVLSRL